MNKKDDVNNPPAVFEGTDWKILEDIMSVQSTKAED